MKKQKHATEKQSAPLVSVIMPVYNAKEYISSAVNSILSQTHKNLELIIVDDCSNDGTQDILKILANQDIRIRLYRNKKKGFLSGSLNFALRKAKGEYIARMDADDISLPKRLEKQLSYLEKHSDVVAVGCQEDIINAEDEIIADKFFPQKSDDCYDYIMNFMVIQPPTLMARARIMKHLRYDTGIAKHDDIDMHFQLLQFGKFANIPDIAFQYRVTPTSYTHAKIKEVYRMACRVRLRAMIQYNYRPSVKRFFLFLGETALVSAVTDRMALRLFEMLRYSKHVRLEHIPRLAFNLLFTVA